MAVFNSSVFSSTVFSTGGEIINRVYGGFFPDHHKKYREYLEKLTGIRKKEEVTKQEINVIKKIAKRVKVDVPEIKIAAKQRQREIDYSAIALEVSAIQQKIIMLLEQAATLQMKKNKDEEIALVLLMSI